MSGDVSGDVTMEHIQKEPDDFPTLTRRYQRELLAHCLLDVAETVVDRTDRGVRFVQPRPTGAAAPYDERLLVFLGRHPSGPLGKIRDISPTRPGRVS